VNARVRISPAADADISAAVEFIARGSGVAARCFLESVFDTFDRIRANPEGGRACELRDPRLQSVQWCPVQGFRAFLVFYRVGAEDVVVLRVLHGARDLPRALADQWRFGSD